MWFGVRGFGPNGLFRCSTVMGRLFTIAITSYNRVRREVLSSLLDDWSRTAVRTFLTVRICLSQTPPMWLANGTFIMNSHPNFFNCSWSIASIALINYRFAPKKFVPWSHRIWRTVLWTAMKERRALINASVDKSSSISMCFALEHMQVSNKP